MCLPKINLAYQTRLIKHDAEPERLVPEQMPAGSYASWFRRKRAVGVLPM